ncbi:MAG TPA: DUF3987 domain-containing protein [Candidatus Saccharimonadales bacterium]|jgi:hypothetical protein
MSWILDYVSAIDSVSESPVQFHTWSAVSVIAAVLKRNVFFSYKNFTIYPNQYIVLVAGPGIGKGTAITPAHKFAKDCAIANYMSDRITAPRIIEKLHQGFSPAPVVQAGQVIVSGKDASATLMSSELATLLTSSDWMLEFLCDAWDRGEFDYDTKNKGTNLITDMCVSLIGACVPDYIRRLNKDANATISSGFSARTIFVYGKQKSKILSWAEGVKAGTPLALRFQILEGELKSIAALRGEMKFDGAARVLWDAWYKELHDDFSTEDTEVYNNFRSRQPIHVLKVAMVLSVSERGDLIISESILARAIRLVELIAEGLVDVFRGVGESDISIALARLEMYFERRAELKKSSNGSGPLNLELSYNEILGDNIRIVNHDDIIRVLKVLVLTGFLLERTGNGITYYKYTGKKIRSRP